MNKQISTPWGQAGYITYKRTYARELENGKTEEWEDTIERVIDAAQNQLHVGFTKNEEDQVYEIMHQLKGTVAGRFLWQLGTKTVDRLGLPSLQNCALTLVDQPVRPFTWAFEMLMLGVGVGYNIQREYVYQIPKVLTKVNIRRIDEDDADFIVPDKREGWIELLKKILEASFFTGKGFTFACHLIRSKGSPIKGFGGIASGPDELVWGMLEINKILNSMAGKKLRPIHALDIMNIIGKIVVSGNVRRSAQIAIGDYDDIEFLRAKRWDLGNIPNWRAMSNNSVACDDITKLPDEFWYGYTGNGEPYGLINLEAARRMGRTGELQYPDPRVVGFNPCQPEFATILTRKGVKTFKELSEGDEIWSKEDWTHVIKKWSTGVKPVYNTHTSGGVFTGTLKHRVDTREGKVEVERAKSILTLSGSPAEKVEYDPQIVMDGLFLGDGYHKHMDREYTYPVLIIGENDMDYFDSEIKHLFISEFSNEGKIEMRVKTTITDEESNRTFSTKIPERYYLKNAKTTISLLRGLYTANGSVISKGKSSRISYKSTSLILIHQMQQMLSSIGIRSYYTINKPKDVVFDNGTYGCKESYDLNISRDTALFISLIGFIQSYKTKLLKELSTRVKHNHVDSYTKVLEKEYLGDFEVFDITVDNPSHTYWTGGLSVSNCAEQPLEDKETCCLAETFLPNITSYRELMTVLTLLYRIAKHSLALPCSLKETEFIVNSNMRMGLGITGYLQATEEQRSWLKEAYNELREYDKYYSKLKGFPESIKLTTVKPSGTLSLLADVTPGAHPGYAQYYIRRIRMASDSPLIDVCRKHGYIVENQYNNDGTIDYTTSIVQFPSKFPKGTMLAKDMSAIDQLNVIKRLQAEWSDNSVSITVYYHLSELDAIKQWLKENYANVKSVSFLLHSDHGFKQAPIEEITEEQYNEMIKNVVPINYIKESISLDDMEVAECESGACPIR